MPFSISGSSLWKLLEGELVVPFACIALWGYRKPAVQLQAGGVCAALVSVWSRSSGTGQKCNCVMVGFQRDLWPDGYELLAYKLALVACCCLQQEVLSCIRIIMKFAAYYIQNNFLYVLSICPYNEAFTVEDLQHPGV